MCVIAIWLVHLRVRRLVSAPLMLKEGPLHRAPGADSVLYGMRCKVTSQEIIQACAWLGLIAKHALQCG